MAKQRKIPGYLGESPTRSKTPRHLEPNPSTQRQPIAAFEDRLPGLSYRFAKMRLDGPFSWRDITREQWIEVVKALRSLETLNWNELIKRGCHPVDFGSMSTEAQKEITGLRLEVSHESAFSIRITGRRRVWCLYNFPVFDLLWYDPEHAVCPSLGANN